MVKIMARLARAHPHPAVFEPLVVGMASLRVGRWRPARRALAWLLLAELQREPESEAARWASRLANDIANGDGDGDGDGNRIVGNAKRDVPGDDRSEVVAPFDTMWHVHCGKGRNASVVAALRQKRFGGGDGDDAGAALVASTGDLAPPPTRRREGR